MGIDNRCPCNTRNSSGDEIAKRDFSVYLYILKLYINSCIINK